MVKLNKDNTSVATIGVIVALVKTVVKDLDGRGLNLYGDSTRENPDMVLNRLVAARINNTIKNEGGIHGNR